MSASPQDAGQRDSQAPYHYGHGRDGAGATGPSRNPQHPSRVVNADELVTTLAPTSALYSSAQPSTLPEKNLADQNEGAAQDDITDPLSKAFDYAAWSQAVRDRQIRDAHLPGNADPNQAFMSTALAWHDLKMVGGIGGDGWIETFTSVLLAPLLWGRDVAKGQRSTVKHQPREVLHGISGLALPGEMVLVLGKPGSGCSTLLRSLADETRSFSSISGERLVNGDPLPAFMRANRGCINMMGEEDYHRASLTVQQTLEFTLACKMPGPENAAARAHHLNVVLTLLGLQRCKDTPVGDHIIRGISGGEKRRTTIAETLCCGASVNLWDGSIRGLDSSSALDFCKALKVACNAFRTTQICSFYQTSEDIYKLFDRVVLLSYGHMIYSGPASEARAYFEKMGFVCPYRKTTADFLTGITEFGERVVEQGREKEVPMTTLQFAQRFRESDEYRRLESEIAAYKREAAAPRTAAATTSTIAAGQPAQPNMATPDDTTWHDAFETAKNQKKLSNHERASPKQVYSATFAQQCKAALRREFQLKWGDKPNLIGSALFQIIMAIFSGLFYLRFNNTSADAFARGSVNYFLLVYNALSAQAMVPGFFEGRAVGYKQQDLAIAKPSASFLMNMFADLPIRMLTNILFVIISYFMSNLNLGSAGYIFRAFLVVILASQAFLGLCRLLSAICRDLDAALSVIGILLIGLLLNSGYLLPLTSQVGAPTIPGWWVWIYWISPISIGLRAMLANEFAGRVMPCVAPQLVPIGPTYDNFPLANRACSLPGAVPGSPAVTGDQYVRAAFGYRTSDYWWCIGVLIAYILLYAVITIVAVDRVRFGKGGVITRQFHRNLRRSTSEDLERSEHRDAEEVPVSSVVKPGERPAATDLVTEKYENELARRAAPMTWTNINYHVQDGKLQLLNQIEGWALPGRMVALVGASGAGKSTLLDCITQRKTTGKVTGEIVVGGKPQGRSFKRRTGFVEQLDLHDPFCTVREALLFSATLRQDADVSDDAKLRHVNEVIAILEMEEIADAVVGTIEKGVGISVEERKRLTIGVELVSQPEILFLDEPTSGLSSEASFSIIRLIRKLANSGQAILCTIHQPSAVLFEQFDDLLIVINQNDGKGGQVAYFGELGRKSATMLDYFRRNGAQPMDDEEANPAEYVLGDVLNAGMGRGTSINWSAIWQASQERQAVLQRIDEIREKARVELPATPTKGDDQEFSLGFWRAMPIVTARALRSHNRNLSYTLGQLMLLTVSSFCVGTTFTNVGAFGGDGMGSKHTGSMTPSALQNLVFVLFYASTLAFLLVSTSQPTYVMRQTLYQRERSSGFYDHRSFVASVVLAQIPFLLLGSVTFFTLTYFPVRLDFESARAAYFWVSVFVFFIFANTLGYLIAAITPNLQVAQIFSPFLVATAAVLSSGVTIPIPQIGWWVRWVSYVTPFRYFLEGLTGNEFGGLAVRCNEKAFVTLQPPAGLSCDAYFADFFAAPMAAGYVRSAADGTCQYCPYASGDEYLRMLGWRSARKWMCFGLLWVYILFNICALLYVTSKKTGKR